MTDSAMQRLQGLISETETEIQRLWDDMKLAEALAERLGLDVPWKPAKGARKVHRKQGYRIHKDGRDTMLEILSGDRWDTLPWTMQKLLAEANVRMAARGEAPYTQDAIREWLRKFIREGIVRKSGENHYVVVT